MCKEISILQFYKHALEGHNAQRPSMNGETQCGSSTVLQNRHLWDCWRLLGGSDMVPKAYCFLRDKMVLCGPEFFTLRTTSGFECLYVQSVWV